MIQDSSPQDIKNRKTVYNILYTGVLAFYVFSFSLTVFPLFDDLIDWSKESIKKYVEMGLLLALWMFVILHLFSSFLRTVSQENTSYRFGLFVSDCIEVFAAIFLAGAMYHQAQIISVKGSLHSISYSAIYIILIVIAINQFVWFKISKTYDKPALFRLGLFLIGLIVMFVTEIFYVGIWRHILFVSLFALLTIIRITEKT